MLRVIFENGPVGYRLNYVSQRDALFDHLLLRMLCDAKLSTLKLPTNPS